MNTVVAREISPILTLEVREGRPNTLIMGYEDGSHFSIIFGEKEKMYYFFHHESMQTGLISILLKPRQEVVSNQSFGFDDVVPLATAMDHTPFRFGFGNEKSSFAVVIAGRLSNKRQEGVDQKTSGGRIIIAGSIP